MNDDPDPLQYRVVEMHGTEHGVFAEYTDALHAVSALKKCDKMAFIQVEMKMGKSHTAAQIRIAIMKNPGISPTEVSKIVGCSPGAVRQSARRQGLTLGPDRNVRINAASREKPDVKAKEEPKPKAPPQQVKYGMMGSGRVYRPDYVKVL